MIGRYSTIAMAGALMAGPGLVTTAVAIPLDTAITYQGQLKQNGTPATGMFDLQFRLFDAAMAGNQLGGAANTIRLDNVSVTNGLFTVALDFGAQYNGDARWLEVGVHPGALPVLDPYTILSPRQSMTAIPYALYALDGPGGAGGFWAANGTNIRNTNSGNVGIGVVSPTARLDVASPSSGSTCRIRAGNSTQDTWVQLWSGHTNGSNDPAIIWSDATAGDDLRFGTGDADGSPFTEWMRIKGDGKVGINQTAPGARLHVSRYSADPAPAFMVETTVDFLGSLVTRQTTIDHGAINCIQTNVVGGAAPLRLNSTSAGDVLLAEGGGSVGIGTSNPQAPLNIVLSGGGDVRVTTPGGVPGLIFFAENGRRRDIRAYDDTLRILSSSTSSAPASTNGIIITDNGNVGIGIATPAAKLDVNGTTRTDILEITGADLAEKFPVSDRPEPGMVLEIDPDNAGKLRIARGAYNRRVAGIVSGANDFSVGAILGSRAGSNDAPPVALSGRVYCHCDAASGAINPGDLLTTSESPGHAMRVTDHARASGAILGKAMTALKQGEKGMVLVLVTLQ